MKFDLNEVKLLEGFFFDRLVINEKVTIPAVYDRFKETGRFDALKCKKTQITPHFFWDSDVAKWLEAAAYYLARKNDEKIRGYYDEAVKDITENALPCGYFNSYFQVEKPDEIFTDRDMHELYCAGHLFEAAAASARYLGDERLLVFSEKFADYIAERFTVKKDAGFETPGHEEIELALLKLYELTGKEKYKKLAEFFIERRGKSEKDEKTEKNDRQRQSHASVYEQDEAVGHAVRALYLYIAMGELAAVNNDEGLKKSVVKLFENIIDKKMYVTGGVGSTHIGEAFTDAYRLPNYYAYSETCASIALMLFADKVFALTKDPRCGHVFERTLYNAFLAGTSLEGDRFFYVNPLEMRIDSLKFNYATNPMWREPAPLAERVKVFDCSCCPPNICRFIEEIPQFIWNYDDENNDLYLLQFISSSLTCRTAKIKIASGFPYDGKVKITVTDAEKPFTLKIRKPEWCDKKFASENNGYLVYEIAGETEISLDFEMRLRKIFPNVRVKDDEGKVALSYGPFILCAEGADNAFGLDGIKIGDITGAKPTSGIGKINFDLPVTVFKASPSLWAYNAPACEERVLRLIPYYSWANRGANDMKVWFCEK